MNKDVEILLAKQTVGNYKKAAKLILKENLSQYCQPLIDYMEKLLVTRKSYETICIILETVGALNCQSALGIIKEICDEDIEHDLITSCAAKAYIRLVRKDLSDVSQIIDYIKNKKFSVQCGVTDALGYDKMVPSLVDQEKLIKLCWDLGQPLEPGYAEPRYGIAAACAGWEGNIVDSFLNQCIKANDVPLKYVASKSLQRKYVKLR